MTDLPIGTVTFLFTDIEGSTTLLARPEHKLFIFPSLEALALVAAARSCGRSAADLTAVRP